MAGKGGGTAAVTVLLFAAWQLIPGRSAGSTWPATSGSPHTVPEIMTSYSSLRSLHKPTVGKDLVPDKEDLWNALIQKPFFPPPVAFDKLKASVAADAGTSVTPESAWDLIRLGMGGNPRKTKRFDFIPGSSPSGKTTLCRLS